MFLLTKTAAPEAMCGMESCRDRGSNHVPIFHALNRTTRGVQSPEIVLMVNRPLDQIISLSTLSSVSDVEGHLNLLSLTDLQPLGNHRNHV